MGTPIDQDTSIGPWYVCSMYLFLQVSISFVRKHTYTDYLGTMEFYDFPFSWEWNNHPNWRTPWFFRGVKTTNQIQYEILWVHGNIADGVSDSVGGQWCWQCSMATWMWGGGSDACQTDTVSNTYVMHLFQIISSMCSTTSLESLDFINIKCNIM